MVNVATAVPLPVSVRLGALVVEPLPNTYVLVTEASETKPPVPVRVTPTALVILSTVVPAVVCANIILPVPNAMERAVE